MISEMTCDVHVTNIVKLNEAEKTEHASGDIHVTNIVKLNEAEKTEHASGDIHVTNIVKLNEAEKTEHASGGRSHGAGWANLLCSAMQVLLMEWR